MISYTSLRLLATYVRLELLHWDVFDSEVGTWKLHKWYTSLCPISNSDNDILSPLIEQTILPVLTETVSSIWDPMSTSQTKLLALSLIQINQVRKSSLLLSVVVFILNSLLGVYNIELQPADAKYL